MFSAVGAPSVPFVVMTSRVAGLPVQLRSLAVAFWGAAEAIEGAGRRVSSGLAGGSAGAVFALSSSARDGAFSVRRVATALEDADSRRNSIADVLQVARSQVGVVEKPTNRQKYGAWFGANGVFWCAEFVSWVFAQAGHSLPISIGAGRGASGFAYCQYGRDAAWKRGELFRTPRVGDVFFHFRHGDSGPGHTGIVVDVLPDGRIVTIEGNASTGSGRDGGGVVRQIRPKSYVRGLTFWRVLPSAPGDTRGPSDRAPRPSTLRLRSATSGGRRSGGGRRRRRG